MHVTVMHPIASLFGEDGPRTTPQFSSSVSIGLPALTEFVPTRGRLCEEARFVINVFHEVIAASRNASLVLLLLVLLCSRITFNLPWPILQHI